MIHCQRQRAQENPKSGLFWPAAPESTAPTARHGRTRCTAYYLLSVHVVWSRGAPHMLRACFWFVSMPLLISATSSAADYASFLGYAFITPSPRPHTITPSPRPLTHTHERSTLTSAHIHAYHPAASPARKSAGTRFRDSGRQFAGWLFQVGPECRKPRHPPIRALHREPE